MYYSFTLVNTGWSYTRGASTAENKFSGRDLARFLFDGLQATVGGISSYISKHSPLQGTGPCYHEHSDNQAPQQGQLTPGSKLSRRLSYIVTEQEANSLAESREKTKSQDAMLVSPGSIQAHRGGWLCSQTMQNEKLRNIPKQKLISAQSLEPDLQPGQNCLIPIVVAWKGRHLNT